MTQSYVFWLTYRTSNIPAKEFGVCKVTGYSLEIITKTDNLCVPLTAIRKCEFRHTYSKYKYDFAEIELDLPSGENIRLTDLRVADVIFRQLDYQETSLMVDLINAFKSNKVMQIEANPYKRAFKTLGLLDYFVESEWDPNTSPEKYSDRVLIKYVQAKSNEKAAYILYPGLLFGLGLSTVFLFTGEIDGGVVMGLITSPMMVILWILHRQSHRYSKLLTTLSTVKPKA